ncbi:glycosyltransferase [Halapricum sp. CBA1109]|uniref:glycosyltransferase family 4 protein n=1 Tax=Halapricum sp. CBA1109 TaxID=2668068 RepID=UPI0012FA0B86|nr:glycosyltransferase family 4 protein [Halapricum sp. CBA1109]MUV88799.1 glycosyltransferase [Halapricum sp. CBA1109]
MKIGMVSDTFHPKVGGAEIHVKELSKALRNRGHEVSVLTFTDGNDTVEELPVTRLQYSPWDPTTGVATLLTNDIGKIAAFIRNHDLIHTHYTFMSSAIVGVLSSILRTPMVTTLHGLGTLDSSVSDSVHKKTFRRLSFLSTQRIISTSEEMASVAERYVPDDIITVIPNAVDTGYFKPQGHQDSGETLTILSVRRLNPKNGVQYLIDASPTICERVEDVEIIIAGNGGKDEMMEYLKNRVVEHGTEEHISFLGEVPNEQTRDLYDRSDIVVFPSSAESTSIACLEAMSMQCAVVASDISAYRSMLGSGKRGVLVELFDRNTSDYDAPMILPEERIQSLAESIISLYENPERRQNLGREAREYVVTNHDWSIIAEKIEEEYYSVHG